MALFDSAMLTLLLWDGARPPLHPDTGVSVTNCKERIAHLVSSLHKSKQRILIPTPVLSEVLVVSGGSGLKYLEIIHRSPVFRVVPFDTLAAVELAELNRAALQAGDKKGGVDSPWQKIKLDRQILSCGRVVGAKTLYTDDCQLATFASRLGMNVVRVHELPLPDSTKQLDMLESLHARAAEEEAHFDDEQPDDAQITDIEVTETDNEPG